jgi:ketosteroid isomerase-like protein
MSDLARRIDRLESIEQIRQLVSKYALAIDMRDLDALVNLYVEDVRIDKNVSGRHPLKQSFVKVVRAFKASVHHVGNQIVEFDDPDNAHGLVYCRCEHEVEDKWVPVYLYYLDRYARVDGVWYFKRRVPCELYGTDMLDRPVGPQKLRWPNHAPAEGTWHSYFPSWAEFWADPGKDVAPVAAPAPPEKFLDTMRRGERHARAPNFSWMNADLG